MKPLFNFFLLFLFLINGFLQAQKIAFKDLEKKVTYNNHIQKFDASIQLISNFISSDASTSFDKYSAYLLKSYTYKAIFNYDETFKALNLALQEGLKSDKVDEVKATIMAEKAFAFFDLQKYDQASELMTQLRNSKYKYLDLGNTAYIIMQEGYIDYLNKKYDTAETKFDDAILIIKKVNPENLPVIYGKKMELYKMTGDNIKSKQTFDLGLESSVKSKNIKYQIYMYEQLREQQMFDGKWKDAFKSFQIIDQLKNKYNAEDTNNILRLFEKDIEIQKKGFEIKKQENLKYFLMILLVVLLAILYLGYRLFKSDKQRSILIENEYARINQELKTLTTQLADNGYSTLNFAEHNLSERQLEIISLIRESKSNKEIATILFISENTVKYHLKSIYEILNIENRNEFLKYIN